MAFKLRMARAEYDETLGNTGVIARCIAPTNQIAKKIRNLMLDVEKNNAALEKFQRRAFGLVFSRLDGVEIEGQEGDRYELEKDDDGYLTDSALEYVRPLGRVMQNVVLRMLGLEDGDAKN